MFPLAAVVVVIVWNRVICQPPSFGNIQKILSCVFFLFVVCLVLCMILFEINPFLTKRTTPKYSNWSMSIWFSVAYNYTLAHTAAHSYEKKKEYSLFLIHMPHQFIIFVMQIHSVRVFLVSLSLRFGKRETEGKGWAINFIMTNTKKG